MCACHDKEKHCSACIEELRHHPASALFTVARHATYLGFDVGPEAQETQWRTVTAKINKRVEEVLFPSMAARVMVYNSHFVSLLMYKAQLAQVSREASAAAARALQRTTKAPWQAIPNDFLHNATLYGLPIDAFN